MAGTRAKLLDYGKETVAVSGLYVLSFIFTFKVLMPVQSMFFPEFSSQANLLFLPHGIRVLAAWVLGWRSVIALTPGVLISLILFANMPVPGSISLAILAVNVAVAPAVFQSLYFLGWKIAPQSGRTPCWPCVMVAGLIISVVSSSLINLIFGSASVDYFAYMIGDISGLFFLMLILMLIFRSLRAR